MRSLLQQLENNETILLMYLSGELDALDQKEVAQLLSHDQGLAQQLRQMEADQAAVTGALASLDIALAPAVEARRLRQVSRLMKRWQIERLTRPAAARRATRGVPRWVYPVVAAAAVLCIVLGWWGMNPDSPSATQVAREDNAVNKTDGVTPPSPVVIDIKPGATSAGTSLGAVWPLTQPEEASNADEAGNSDSDVQQQASALSPRTEDASSTASIFMTDNND